MNTTDSTQIANLNPIVAATPKPDLIALSLHQKSTLLGLVWRYHLDSFMLPPIGHYHCDFVETVYSDIIIILVNLRVAFMNAGV